MGKLNDSEYVRLLHQEVGRMRSLAPDHLGLPIPHIEGWTIGTVLGHTGWVARYVDRALCSSPEHPPRRGDIPEPPPADEVLDWFNEATGAVIERFSTVDLDDIVPTFTGPQPARWWLRRLSHETAMHRWDAASAIGSAQPIDAAQAIDGIDEVLQTFASARLSFEVLAGHGEVVHLHATDRDDGEWLITLEADRIEWVHGHAKGNVAARGPASDLLLLLWGRIPPSRLELFGDATLLERWQAAATF